MTQHRLTVAAVFILGAAALLCLAGDLATLLLQVPKSPNEGWNAYHALHAMAGTGLYPYRDTLLFNNYPPLSYFMVGPFGRLLGDHIIAGRVDSLLAALGIAWSLFAAARLLGCGRIQAALAGAMFLASPWVLTKLAGIDDPQLLGNFLDALGLVVVLRRPSSMGHIALAALLFTGAMFVKLLFVDLPLAVFLWLWFTQRRGALLLAGLCAALGIGGILASNLLLHVDLLAHVFSARVFLPGQMFAHPGQWLVSGALPLMAALCLLRRRGDPGALLAGLYAAVSIPLTLFFSGGEGVSAGPTFDLSMAAALGAAIFLTRGPAYPRLFLAGTALMALVAFASFFGLWSSSPSSFAVFAQRVAARDAIARIRAAPGPVLCEMLALCYWAGKPAEVDAFGLGEAFKRHVRNEHDLTARLDAHAYALIQLTPKSSFDYSPGIKVALARDYRLARSNSQGRFYLPR